MNYLVGEKKGERVAVALREVGEDLFDVTVEGSTVRVDIARTGRTISVIEDGRQWEVVVDERGAHGFDVLVAGRLLQLEAEDERSQRLAQSVKLTLEGPQTVSADMPGKVIKVTVAVGDEVEEGQGIAIIEAMKMENEIVSPIEGRVTQVAIAQGDTVETGATLFTIEPLREG